MLDVLEKSENLTYIRLETDKGFQWQIVIHLS